jgi:C-methyltransferase
MKLYPLIILLVAVFIGIEIRFLTVETADPGPIVLILFNHLAATALRSLADLLTKPYVKVLEDGVGQWRANVIDACIRAGIAEHVESGPKTLPELTNLTHASSPEALLRLLRAAESMGYFQEGSDHRWRHSRLTRVLLPNSATSVRYLLRHFHDDAAVAWTRLYESIFLDKHAFSSQNNNQSLWEVYAQDQAREQQFQRAMANHDAFSTQALAGDYDWSKFRRVVDYGGGFGSLLAAVMTAHRYVNGVLFDLPAVIQQSEIDWHGKNMELISRTLFVPGHFFEPDTLPVIESGDVIVLRTVLHDWGDEDSVRIMSHLRHVIGETPDVTVILAEMVLTDHDPLPVKYLMDLHMRIMFHEAKERYLGDWQQITSQAGFDLKTVHQTRSLWSFIELHPKEVTTTRTTDGELDFANKLLVKDVTSVPSRSF